MVQTGTQSHNMYTVCIYIYIDTYIHTHMIMIMMIRRFKYSMHILRSTSGGEFRDHRPRLVPKVTSWIPRPWAQQWFHTEDDTNFQLLLVSVGLQTL